RVHSLRLLCSCYADHRDPPSFPTRRSSDLGAGRRKVGRALAPGERPHGDAQQFPLTAASCSAYLRRRPRGDRKTPQWKLLRVARSEEHTSELQSRRDLVCRLLLEKKKKK